MIGELGSGTEAVGQLEDGTRGRALTVILEAWAETLLLQTEVEGNLFAHISRSVPGLRHHGIREPG